MQENTHFIITVNTNPNDVRGELWQSWSKKYTSMRRAEQALSYYMKNISPWAIRIESCLPATSQQDRDEHNIRGL